MAVRRTEFAIFLDEEIGKLSKGEVLVEDFVTDLRTLRLSQTQIDKERAKANAAQ